MVSQAVYYIRPQIGNPLDPRPRFVGDGSGEDSAHDDEQGARVPSTSEANTKSEDELRPCDDGSCSFRRGSSARARAVTWMDAQYS